MKCELINNSNWQEKAELFDIILSRLSTVLPTVHFESVELLLTDDEQIHALNLQYRQKDKATDVLSFGLAEDITQAELLGQIIISVETAERQAKELGQSLDDELQFLFTHGLLHCLGYDHQTPEEEAEMLEKAYALLERKRSSL